MLGDGTFESGRPHAPTPSSSAVLAAASPLPTRPPLPTRLLKPIPSSSASAALAAASSSLSRPPAQLLDFPPIEKDSGQKAGESLDAFFLRRQAENSRRSERESLNDRQARAQREAHAQKGLPPGKRGSRVYYWEKDSGHYIRYAAGRGNYEAYFEDYPPAQRHYDSFKDEWDLCSAFGDDDHPGDDDPPDDNDEPVESGDVVLTDRDLIATNVLHALNLRFGFVEGHNVPAPFDAPPPLVVMRLVGQDDAASAALAAAFFAQCLQGSSPGDIAVSLFDFHQATSALHRPWPYEVHRKVLRNMHDHSDNVYYAVSDHGCRIGSDVLLLHNAADVLEIIRQEWGPRVKDVARHLLLRGMTFWMAIVSSEIMRTTQPTASSIRQARLNARFDVRAGLGYRAPGYKADNHDYHAYFVQRNSLLHTSRGSVALQYGGVIARLARSQVSEDNLLHGPSENVYETGVCLWDQELSYAYWYDSLTDREIGILCGVYHVGTGRWRSSRA
ncbi:hypothetical protein B0H14DRAFT_2422511 [Mycena olivaceomarginata]|nr:hypothetical protein B0H14DRAFT_2422511 [Mycena olivaceomarginata]